MELNRIAIPYNVLQRDVESDRALYESVTLRLKETYITEGIDNTPFRVIEEPLVASSPSKPRKKFILTPCAHSRGGCWRRHGCRQGRD